jgi:hypothetical protein
VLHRLGLVLDPDAIAEIKELLAKRATTVGSEVRGGGVVHSRVFSAPALDTHFVRRFEATASVRSWGSDAT